MMRHHLAHRPVHVLECTVAQAQWRHFCLAHLLAQEVDLELDVVPSFRLIGLVVQVIERRGITVWSHVGRSTKRLQRLSRHDERRYVGREALGEEWAEWLVFPGLYIARRPVVDKTEPEDGIGRVRYRNLVSHRIPARYVGADFELVIKLK